MLKFHDKVSQLEIDSCPECFGIWFDNEELKLIFQSPNLSTKILKEDATGSLLTPENSVTIESEKRLCPVCVETPLFASRLGKTQTDYCLSCKGIWLDQSELEELVRAYRQGERGNLIIVNQLAEGLGTPNKPNPKAKAFLETLERYRHHID